MELLLNYCRLTVEGLLHYCGDTNLAVLSKLSMSGVVVLVALYCYAKIIYRPMLLLYFSFFYSILGLV